MAGYKINTQKSVKFLYTNKLSEREMKKTTSFLIALKRIIYLKIHLPKEIQDLYSKEIEDTNKGRDIPC